MDQPSTRLHPIVAARAMRKLLQDREDTRQVFILVDALRGKSTIRQFTQFRQTPEGQTILREKRRLLDHLCDRETLGALPRGTLGREYHEFMSAENLSADGLVEASKIHVAPLPDDDLTLFRERGREMHDLLHIVTGYGRDPVGEACVVAFTYAQNKQLGLGVIALFGGLNIAKKLPGQPVKRAVFEAYRHGRSAGWLIGADWEALLRERVTRIRERFNIKPPKYYGPVLEAARKLIAAQKAATAPVMAAGD